MICVDVWSWIAHIVPAQLSPVNPVSQVQVPAGASHVPWASSVQFSGQTGAGKY